MADYIPFITSPATMMLTKSIYSDAEVVRVPLELLEKVTVPTHFKLWVDSGVDGFHDLPTRDKESRWYKLIQSIDGLTGLGDPASWSHPDKNKVKRCVETLMSKCVKHKPAWITVPQLPMSSDSARNKLNLAFANAAGEWKAIKGFPGKLILPLIFTHQDQIKGRSERRPKLEKARRRYHEAQADGFWVVDTKLHEEEGSMTLRNKRFKSIVALHQEINGEIASRFRIGGPYWGLNLVLWARKLVDYPAIGVGGSYQYYLPGGHSHPPSPRVAIGPLRRRVGVKGIGPWIEETIKIIGGSHPLRAEFSEIRKHLSLLSSPDPARHQVARFYKNWFHLLDGIPPAGRSLALFQDLSAAYALGRFLPDFPGEGAAKGAESVVEPLMLNCL